MNDEDERKFPCADCGVLCTKDEGGAVFTVCDECWDEAYDTRWRQKQELLQLLQGGAIPMLLFCPHCGEQHIDAPNAEKHWTNPPHRSHECQSCGWTWRPADVPTTGVKSIKTKGEKDGRAAPFRLASWVEAVHEVTMNLDDGSMQKLRALLEERDKR